MSDTYSHQCSTEVGHCYALLFLSQIISLLKSILELFGHLYYDLQYI